MNWKPWLHSLIAAAIGGFASAASAAIVVPHATILLVLKLGAVGAVVPVLTLLKQSPLPPDNESPKS